MGWIFLAAVGYGLALLLVAAALISGFPKWANTATGTVESKAYGIATLGLLVAAVLLALLTDLLLKAWP